MTLYTLVQVQTNPTSIKSIMASDDYFLVDEKKSELQAEGGQFFICDTNSVQLSRKALSELSLSYEMDLLEESLCDRLSEAGYSSAVKTDKELIDQMVSHAYRNMRDMDEYDAITETISDFENKLAVYDEAEDNKGPEEK